MGIRAWGADKLSRARRDGPRQAVRLSTYQLWQGLLRRLEPVSRDGTNVLDLDWDVLILLDACRVDALKTVAEDYPFIHTVDSRRSVASNSPEWLRKTFSTADKDTTARVAYVTANPHSEMLDASKFAVLNEVWQYAWTDAGTVRPGAVTDHVVDVMRRNDPERLIAHYMQPHLPFRAEMYPEEATVRLDHDLGHADDSERNVYHRMRDGEVPKEAVWEAYCDNLRWVLDSVSTLLSNVDADRVVISSDHAELFGEWGCYCHPGGVPVPALRRVPWVETTAEDTGSHEPRLDAAMDDTSPDQKTVRQRLNDLGYL